MKIVPNKEIVNNELKRVVTKIEAKRLPGDGPLGINDQVAFNWESYLFWRPEILN